MMASLADIKCSMIKPDKPHFHWNKQYKEWFYILEIDEDPLNNERFSQVCLYLDQMSNPLHGTLQ